MRTFVTSGVCCILSVLIVTVNSLKCQKCNSITENNCQGTEITCDASRNNCGSMYLKTSTGGVEMNVFIKECIGSSDCDETFFLSAENYNIKGISKCCQSDNCDNGIISLPENNTANGLQCPSCFAMNKDKCEESSIINCVGAENRCIYYSALTSIGSSKIKYALRGCASENICSSSQNVLFEGGSVKVNLLECSNAICLHYSLLVPAVAGLHLMRLLL